jgi:hypothetical protein
MEKAGGQIMLTSHHNASPFRMRDVSVSSGRRVPRCTFSGSHAEVPANAQ